MIVAADPDEQVCQFPRKPDGTIMGLYDERFNGMSVAQVFRILEEEQDGSSGGPEAGGARASLPGLKTGAPGSFRAPECA